MTESTTHFTSVFASAFAAISRMAADMLTSWPPHAPELDLDEAMQDAVCKVACAVSVGRVLDGFSERDRPEAEALVLKMVAEALEGAGPVLEPNAAGLAREIAALAQEVSEIGTGPYEDGSAVLGRLAIIDATLAGLQKVAEHEHGQTVAGWMLIRAARAVREQWSRSLMQMARRLGHATGRH